MIDSTKFMEKLIDLGVNKGAGVPCSFLSGLINAAINSGRYENFVNEGDALAYVSGWSAGKKDEYGFCLMQNSGLTNAMSPLTSLNPQFKIPVMMFISWRGEPGVKDEPQHSIMGPHLEELLKACECYHEILNDDYLTAINQISEAVNYMKIERKSVAFIVRKGTFSKTELLNQVNASDYLELMTRESALKVIDKVASKYNLPVVCTTGQTGRQLHDIHDSNKYLYMVGSMGCGQSLAAGLAKSLERKVIFVDGDGALMMRLGACANIAKMRAPIIHVILDNGSYNTTGRQECISTQVDIKRTLFDLGYKYVVEHYHKPDSHLENILWEAIQSCDGVLMGPCAIHVIISNDEVKNLGRPSRSPEQKLIDFRKEFSL